MEIYKRNVEGKISKLRLLLIASVAIAILLIVNDNIKLLYFVAFLLLIFSLIVVDNFRRTYTSLIIDKYFLFGLIRITWTYDKSERVVIKSEGYRFGDDAEVPVFDSGESIFGLLFSMIYSVFGKPKIGRIRFSVQKLKPSGLITKPVYIFLDREEYRMAKEIAVSKHGI